MNKHANMLLAQILGGTAGAIGGYATAGEDESALLRAALFGLGGALAPKVTPEIAQAIGDILPESVMRQGLETAGRVSLQALPYIAPLAAPFAAGAAIQASRDLGSKAVKNIFGG